ncbi:hypothetical protein [Clostridium cylindrosporum]|uniref:Phage DNA packaging protein, Nu1 subunit of terminase n=1 Tax=Clostridium cylindrosporum DSM 605 TaxID=1121307 RepID=A0A0J8G5T4_CLOCY|nr:hypothetical protein [Clostridium cylindrosporum]KMT22996.1 hypothetical protein CLCY_7c00430 [Clostridium cylindrosporum DSM 605]
MSEKEDVIINSKKSEVDNVVVAGSYLANIFGITDRRVRQLAEEGIIVRVKKGRYDLVESIKAYIVYLKTNQDIKESKSDADLDYDREKAMHERVKREMAELNLAEMKGQIHYADDVENVMNDMLSNFRSKVLSMASKLAPILIARSDVNQIQDMINKESYEVLEELSNYDPRLFYSEKYIDLEDEGEDFDQKHEEDKE